MSSDLGTVYALLDPGDGLARWVGALQQAPEQLGGAELAEDAPRAVWAWIAALAEAGQEPRVQALEAVAPDLLAERCWFWTRFLRSQGLPLLNEAPALVEGQWYQLPNGAWAKCYVVEPPALWAYGTSEGAFQIEHAIFPRENGDLGLTGTVTWERWTLADLRPATPDEAEALEHRAAGLRR